MKTRVIVLGAVLLLGSNTASANLAQRWLEEERRELCMQLVTAENIQSMPNDPAWAEAWEKMKRDCWNRLYNFLTVPK